MTSPEKFGEDIPTSMEDIGAQTLNFSQKFKFLQLNFFSGDGVPVGGWAIGCPGQSLARLNISGRNTP